MTTETNPPRERMFNVPGVVLALSAALVLVHLMLAFVLTADQTNRVLTWFAFSPLRYTDVDIPGDVLPSGWGPKIWTFFSYALFHSDLNHLFFNLVWLLAFAPPIARRFGPWRFLAFCAITAVGGAVAHLLTHLNELAPMIGASATVSGAMGAAMRFVFQRGGPLGSLGRSDEVSYHVPAAPLASMMRDPRVLAFLAVWFGVNLLFGVGAVPMPGMGVEATIAWQAHIGGFLVGLLGFALFDPVRPSTAIEAPDIAPASADDETMTRH